MKGLDKMQSNPKVSVVVPVYKVEKIYNCKIQFKQCLL